MERMPRTSLDEGWSEDGFRQYLRNQRTFALTHRLAESFGFIQVHVRNIGLAALGFEGSRTFVGAFDRWVEVPNLLAAWRSGETAWAKDRDPDALLCVFIVVSGLWLLSPWRMDRHWMGRHFVASTYNVRKGRLWCIALAQVSHQQLEHLIVNSLFMYSIMVPIQDLLGRRQICYLYLGGGACGVLLSLWLSPKLMSGGPSVECLGASSSLYAFLGYLMCKSSLVVRWLGRDWTWGEFAAAQLLLDIGTRHGFGSFGTWQTDVVAHAGGAAAGWALASYT
mmetsp:Transcript_30479/g.96934  ORF Transcript_30479/g.96934 Transcript_30479/m.96934 type:complete len:280 (+) Transcript_30479:179-1018(+)